MKILGRLKCWFKGHARRKLVSENAEMRKVSCPRCGHELIYKKPKVAKLQAAA